MRDGAAGGRLGLFRGVDGEGDGPLAAPDLPPLTWQLHSLPQPKQGAPGLQRGGLLDQGVHFCLEGDKRLVGSRR